MGVFFNPLFRKMSEENIKQFELQEYCQISSLTFAKMRRGECVPLEALVKICEYLECDFGDIMTVNPPQADLFDPIDFTKNIKSAVRVFRAALKDFMSESGVKVSDISKMTGLSVNTIKQIFDVRSSVSHSSLVKLNALGDRYMAILKSYSDMYANGIEIAFPEDNEDDVRGYYISKISRRYWNENTAVYIQEALLDLMEENKLTKRELAESLNMSISTLSSVLDRDIKSAKTLEKILLELPSDMLKQLSDLVGDIETPERRKASFRSYLCENCRAYNFGDHSCYLGYDNAMGEDGKYHSTDICTHPKTYTLVFEEAEKRGIDIKTHEQQVYQLKKQCRTDVQKMDK